MKYAASANIRRFGFLSVATAACILLAAAGWIALTACGSLAADEPDLDTAYRAMEQAYRNVFSRCGLRYTKVEADTGNIGGSESHEFMVVADTGEDAIMSCSSCGYGANVEKAATGALPAAPAWPLDTPDTPQEVDTPELRSVDEVAKEIARAILVEDGGDVVGIWTERDYLRGSSDPAFDPTTAKVADYMTSPLHFASRR